MRRLLEDTSSRTLIRADGPQSKANVTHPPGEVRLGPCIHTQTHTNTYTQHDHTDPACNRTTTTAECNRSPRVLGSTDSGGTTLPNPHCLLGPVPKWCTVHRTQHRHQRVSCGAFERYTPAIDTSAEHVCGCVGVAADAKATPTGRTAGKGAASRP